LPNDDPQLARKARGEQVLALGGMFGALAASSCCILPLVFFSLSELIRRCAIAP